MWTLGPAMSLPTCAAVLPQNEHLSVRAMDESLGHFVKDYLTTKCCQVKPDKPI
jgi:hypothetical protein